MKITLTYEEAYKHVRDSLKNRMCWDGDFQVEILPSSENLPGQSRPVTQIIKDIESLNYDSTQKVQAIKKLRELIPGLGLAEAKWSIENWGTWKRKACQILAVPPLTPTAGYGYTVDGESELL